MAINGCNQRLPGETHLEYRTRRRVVRDAIERYLAGRPVSAGYAPGPHRSHAPHEIKQVVNVVTRQYVSVMHPGTLYRVG